MRSGPLSECAGIYVSFRNRGGISSDEALNKTILSSMSGSPVESPSIELSSSKRAAYQLCPGLAMFIADVNVRV
jgi:hypothetical protein